MKTEKVKLSKKSTARLRQRYYKRFGYHKPMPGYSGGTEAKKHFVPPNSVVELLPAMPLLSATERRDSKKKERAISCYSRSHKFSKKAYAKDDFSFFQIREGLLIVVN